MLCATEAFGLLLVKFCAPPCYLPRALPLGRALPLKLCSALLLLLCLTLPLKFGCLPLLFGDAFAFRLSSFCPLLFEALALGTLLCQPLEAFALCAAAIRLRGPLSLGLLAVSLG